MKTNHTKLPMSSNKDISENIQVAEEWRNLNGELDAGLKIFKMAFKEKQKVLI